MSPEKGHCSDLETLGRQVISHGQRIQFILVSYMNLSSQKKDCSACNLVHADFLHGLFFDPEDGGIMFLQNIS
jgi:hypothetical protein